MTQQTLSLDECRVTYIVLKAYSAMMITWVEQTKQQNANFNYWHGNQLRTLEITTHSVATSPPSFDSILQIQSIESLDIIFKTCIILIIITIC